MSGSDGGVVGLKVLKALVWIVYAIATAACIILAFGFALLMFDASPAAGFAQFIYTWSVKFAGPFAGMIEPTVLSNGGVVSWSALVAVVAYAVLAALIGGILNAISRSIYRRTRPQAAPAVVVQQAAPPAAPAQTAPPAPAPAAPAPDAAAPVAPEPDTAAPVSEAEPVAEPAPEESAGAAPSEPEVEAPDTPATETAPEQPAEQ